MDEHQRQPVGDLFESRAKNWPQAVTPVTRMMVRMFRSSDLVLQSATRSVGRHGLSFTEFEVLATLRSFPPPHELAPGELCASILISSGGLTKVLHGLVDKKLIARSAGETDRRSKPVRLTPRGRALVERAMADVVAIDTDLTAQALTLREVDTLTRLLGKLLGQLEPTTDPTKRKENLS